MVNEIAWGYVKRETALEGKNPKKEILIATRQKRSDPTQYGKYVIPGGGRKDTDKSEYENAIREVKEETGIDSKPIYGYRFPDGSRNIEGENFIATVNENEASISYSDSGKSYHGYLVALEPVDPKQEPKETVSDAANPRYVSIEDAFRDIEKFTPAAQVLLGIIKEAEKIN
ncbi:MAG: NUDIX hydrolase [Candidatus Aenigmarchaeota archaeon]|nr:NUDIX hydrolase [Candidatus Aenigmarchaeota archaeon]